MCKEHLFPSAFRLGASVSCTPALKLRVCRSRTCALGLAVTLSHVCDLQLELDRLLNYKYLCTAWLQVVHCWLYSTFPVHERLSIISGVTSRSRTWTLWHLNGTYVIPIARTESSAMLCCIFAAGFQRKRPSETLFVLLQLTYLFMFVQREVLLVTMYGVMCACDVCIYIYYVQSIAISCTVYLVLL